MRTQKWRNLVSQSSTLLLSRKEKGGFRQNPSLGSWGPRNSSFLFLALQPGRGVEWHGVESDFRILLLALATYQHFSISDAKQGDRNPRGDICCCMSPPLPMDSERPGDRHLMPGACNSSDILINGSNGTNIWAYNIAGSQGPRTKDISK